MPGSSLNDVHDASQAPALPASSRSGYTVIKYADGPDDDSRAEYVARICAEVRGLTPAQINERRAERIAQTATNMAIMRRRAEEDNAKRRKRT